MKKIGIMLMVAIFAAIGLNSCQESEAKKDRDVAFKIDSKEQLTQEDYSRIIEYVGEYAEKAQKYVDMQINDNYNAEAQAGMTKLNYEFPLVDKFRTCLGETESSALSEENLKKVAKYAGLIEFTAPLNYTIQTDPEAAGLEEQAPETDNGVIAGAVDTVKIER